MAHTSSQQLVVKAPWETDGKLAREVGTVLQE